MILFKLKKNNNKMIPEAYGKFYPLPVVTQTIGISELADHMAEHNTGFSPGAVQGLLTDMVRCIKELVLKGIAVKIDDLAIFSIGLRTKKGSDNEKEFSVAKNIEGVKLRARATGNLTSSKLDLIANLKNAASLLGEDEETSNPTTPGGDENGASDKKDDAGSKGDAGSKDDAGSKGDSGQGSSSSSNPEGSEDKDTDGPSQLD